MNLFFNLQAAREGDVMLMEKLLERLPNMQQRKKRLNAKDDAKLTPMHYAARYSHYHMIDFLIKNGASKYSFSFPSLPTFPLGLRGANNYNSKTLDNGASYSITIANLALVHSLMAVIHLWFGENSVETVLRYKTALVQSLGIVTRPTAK